MSEQIIGIKFKTTPKVYYFAAGEHEYKSNDYVIVETARGIEYGKIALMPTIKQDEEIVAPLKPIIRIATDEDIAKIQKQESTYKQDLQTTLQLIQESGLDMKVIDVERTFDETKLIVHFTADGRVDFRDLVRKLASVFRVRIELRQIGARDECRLLGGLASCGRPCCCSNHLSDYTHVSIKMAKNQNISLNQGKISGLCGRLMCCLEYENDVYTEVNKRMPRYGSNVTTTEGDEGTVVGLNHLKETVRVKIPDKEKDMFIFSDIPLTELKFKEKQIENHDNDDSDDVVLDEELKKLID